MAGIRRNRRIERAGVNALRTVLENAGHIVQEIDGSNDHGEDLYVRFVNGGQLTSYIAAIQVKSGAKYRRAIGYSIPVGRHAVLWRTSNIPVVGVVYDPEMQMLYWGNITEHLRGVPNNRNVVIGERDTLTRANVAKFADRLMSYIKKMNLEVHPERGQSLREAIAQRLSRASQAVNTETTIGGNPNQLFARYNAWLDDHDDRVYKIGFWASLIAAGIGTVYYVHQFSMKYMPGSFMSWLWTASVCAFGGMMLYASYCEKMAQRRGVFLSSIGTVPIIFYCACTSVPIPDIVGKILAGLGLTLSSNGMLYIFAYYIAREVNRKRRLRAAYGTDDPSAIAPTDHLPSRR